MAKIRKSPSGSALVVSDGATVPTIADRNAIAPRLRVAGMQVFVTSTQCTYSLAADLVTWVFQTSSTSLWAQPVWYVDPTGSDDADGKTLATALATDTELNRRLWPGGRKQILTSDVFVYLNTANPSTAVIYPEIAPNVGTDFPSLTVAAVLTLNIIVGKVSSAPIVLSADAIIPIASTNQRGQFATAAGTFLDNELIEVTSGPGIGGVGYCDGLNGDAQHTFYTGLSVPTIAGSLVNGGHGQDIKPLAGDTVVTTQLFTQIRILDIQCNGFARVFVQYAKVVFLSIGGSTVNSLYLGIGGPVLLSCCQQIGTSGAKWENTCGGAFLLQCRTIRGGKTTLYGTGWCLIGHAMQGTLSLNGQALSYGLNVDGGQLKVGIGNDNNHPGESVFSKWLCFGSYTNLFSGGNSGCIEYTRGNLSAGSTIFNSAAVVVCEGSELQNADFTGFQWGATTALFDYGIVIMANAVVTQGNISPGVIASVWKIPSTVNIVCDNLFFAFSDEPIALKNSRSGFFGGNYNVANNYNETDAGFYLTAQSANVAPTNFSQIKKQGMYKVFGYVAVTTADGAATGTPVLNVTWTDDSGVVQTKAVATGPALTTLGGNGGEVIIECGPSLALATWSITGVGSIGAARFSVRMRVEKDCFGP